jgi:hypothetical protein
MSRRPLIANHTTARVLGWGLLVAGMLALYDAYDGRDIRKPWWSGPILPW